MDIRKYLKSAFVIALSAITLSSCVDKDEWETPPINCTNKFDAPTISMADFVAKTPASGYILIPSGANDPVVIFDAYVVSSDENGNFSERIETFKVTSDSMQHYINYAKTSLKQESA